MTIAEIYHSFQSIGCLTFATINQHNQPETRIAHLRGYDADGLYFMTMFTKDFYQQLHAHPHISICGMSAPTQVAHDQNGMPLFESGYTIRLTGTVAEVPIAQLRAKNNPIFDLCLKDHALYPAMVVFCITTGRGDIFDYDFEKISRDNKLNRTYFSYNGATIHQKGLTISPDRCINCGICFDKCSFLAISAQNDCYTIDINRCDECGDCYVHCPQNAISYRGELCPN